MLNFLTPKSKIQVHTIREIPLESLEIMGVAQVNPYYNYASEDLDIFLTVVSFAYGSRDYDEKEGMVLTKYFTVKKCPQCKRVELIPVRMRINLDSIYQKHEEEIAYDAFEENPSRRRFPTTVSAYCKCCSSCFEIRIKSTDCWIKEAKKIKDIDLVTKEWEEYNID